MSNKPMVTSSFTPPPTRQRARRQYRHDMHVDTHKKAVIAQHPLHLIGIHRANPFSAHIHHISHSHRPPPLKNMRSNSTTFLLSLLVLLLGLVAQQAQAQLPTFTTKDPTASSAGDDITTPTIPDEPDLPAHEKEEVSVVIDLKIAGAGEEHAQAIASLLKHLERVIPGKKVNCTVEWKGERKEKESDSDVALISRRRLLRSYDFGVPPRALAQTNKTCTLEAGENYNITTITLNGVGDKGVVNALMKILMNPNQDIVYTTSDGTPLFSFVCHSNVRMQSEAPPAEFQTMSEDKGNDAGKIAAIAVPVTLVGVGLVGTAGFFAFKSMSAAAV